MRLTSRRAPRGRGHDPIRALVALALLALALGGCSDKRITIAPPPAPTWTRLTDASLRDPVFPDWRGDSIAFCARFGGEEYQVALWAADGSGGVTYPSGSQRSDYAPRFVGDSLLVFYSNREWPPGSTLYDIWYRNRSDGATRRLTSWFLSEMYPAPRPLSAGMAYTEATPGGYLGRIVLIPDTAAVDLERRYITPDTLLAGEPDWDPTGTRMAFTARGPDMTYHIWVATLGATDTTLTELTSGPFHDLGPRWRPDGSGIAFASDRTGRSGVWFVEPGGESAGLRRIAFEDTGARVSSLGWSPDGQALVVSSNGRGASALWILRDLGLP